MEPQATATAGSEVAHGPRPAANFVGLLMSKLIGPELQGIPPVGVQVGGVATRNPCVGSRGSQPVLRSGPLQTVNDRPGRD